jgi:hypothetical protein
MLKALRTSVMLLALVGTVRASDIFTPPASPPPPLPPHVVVEQPAPADSFNNYTPDTLMEIALDMLAVLPSLF